MSRSLLLLLLLYRVMTAKSVMILSPRLRDTNRPPLQMEMEMEMEMETDEVLV